MEKHSRDRITPLALGLYLFNLSIQFLTSVKHEVMFRLFLTRIAQMLWKDLMTFLELHDRPG